MTLNLHASPQEVMRAVEALQEYARARDIPERTVFALALSLEECGSNIVNHAFRGDPEQTFKVSFDLTGDSFVIELRDRGPAFDPTTAATPQTPGTDIAGGWGIQLVRHYIEDIRYTREAGENVLRLTKRLLPAPGASPNLLGNNQKI